jgi:hypothetical protein
MKFYHPETGELISYDEWLKLNEEMPEPTTYDNREFDDWDDFADFREFEEGEYGE